MRPVGLYGNIEPFAVEGVDERVVDLQRRLSAGEHDEGAGAPLADGLDDVVDGHLAIGLEVGVAERTPEVAAAEPHKDGGTARVTSFALERIEDFVDAIGLHRYSR